MPPTRKPTTLFALFLAALVICPGPSAPAADEGWKPPASPESLEPSLELPDLFTFADGSRVKTQADWERRREEMKRMLLYYQYGRIPPRPDSVTAVDIKRRPHSSGKGTEEMLTLVIGSKRKLRMRILLNLPKTPGPRPVILSEAGRLGGNRNVPMFLDAGYIFIEYARSDLDPDRKDFAGPAQEAYPGYDWATLSVWAWGAMRLVDYLETRDDVDLEHIATTGHSRGGKMALLTAALDERFAMAIPNQSGAGGSGCYRILGPGAETLGMNDKPWWYHERIQWFGEREEYLPFDQHFLKALVAPRAVISNEAFEDLFANPLGTQVSSMAAQEAFRFLGVPEKNAITYRHGGHSFTTDDWKKILAFAEWHFFNRPPDDKKVFWNTPLPMAGLDFKGRSNGGAAKKQATRGKSREPSQSEPFMSFVKVGDPGNKPDKNFYGRGVFGDVDSAYEIGTRRVTNEQYAVFLNAVATSDPAGLFNPDMQERPEGGIVRLGSPGKYTYRVRPELASKTVNFVSWYDALRFCNWLHNGRPSGKQGTATTESGAYAFSGRESVGKREKKARFALSSENEWYKAAYFSPRRGYSNMNIIGRAVVRPENSKSSYGAEQMADKFWEGNEAVVSRLGRGLRSGGWFQGNNRQAAGRFFSNQEMELANIGFRVVRTTD
ncbi:MAG: SUMF1/EgtB/PvdO family nonheme iron enzyme [Planctomycetes bacterium]|nr:SUMF1/EgtB/PvdO family nonheme iron enzyme [Planctomycetota bacterium]